MFFFSNLVEIVTFYLLYFSNDKALNCCSSCIVMHLKIYLLEQESHSRTNVGVVWGVFSCCFLFFPFSLFALEELYGKIYHSRLGGSVLSGGLSSVS